MRVMIQCLFVALLVSHVVVLSSYAQEPEEATKPSLTVNETLSAMATLLRDGKLVDEEVLERVNIDLKNTNAAEQYLIGVLEGALFFQQQKYFEAIARLEQLTSLEEQLSDEQISGSLFRQIHALLSDIYVALQDYDKAFVEKKNYLLKLFKETETLDQKHLASLTEKYQLERKNKAKLLLEEQSRLKKLEILDAQRQESENERNMLILMCVSLFFVVLLVRQLTIRRRLLKLTKMDSLTSLDNRISLFEQGRRFFEHANTGQQSLSIIFLDIDYFKNVNDNLGHFAGDKLLVHLAKLSKEAMRSRDVLCRFGGEEFVALLPDASLEEAKAIAQRLKDKIEQNPLLIEDKEVAVSASIGVAEFNTQLTCFEQLINLADNAMYQAKSQGRNQIVAASAS